MTWNNEDAAELSGMLSTSTMKKAFTELEDESKEVMANIAGFDLATPEGVGKATKAQGRSQGILRALDALKELTEENDEEEKSDAQS